MGIVNTQGDAARPVMWQVRRTDCSPHATWENCTVPFYDDTLRTGRYGGFDNGPPCEVRALYTAADYDALREDRDEFDALLQSGLKLIKDLRARAEAAEAKVQRVVDVLTDFDYRDGKELITFQQVVDKLDAALSQGK